MCELVNRMERRKLEVREKILAAAFDLFLGQGVAATTIEEICERADVANRTFFNHFATRQDMIRALAQRRLVNLHDVFFDRGDEAIPARLVGVFDDIAAALVQSGDTYREMIGEMLAASGYGIQRGFNLHDTFVELVKEGVARGEISTAHTRKRWPTSSLARCPAASSTGPSTGRIPWRLTCTTSRGAGRIALRMINAR